MEYNGNLFSIIYLCVAYNIAATLLSLIPSVAAHYGNILSGNTTQTIMYTAGSDNASREQSRRPYTIPATIAVPYIIKKRIP